MIVMVLRMKYNKDHYDNLSYQNMLNLRTTLRTQRQEAESVHKKSVLFEELLWVGTAKHNREHQGENNGRRENEMPCVDRPNKSARIRHGCIRQKREARSSVDLGSRTGSCSRRLTNRSSMRSQSVLQRGTSQGMYSQREYTRSDFKQYGCSQCSQDVLSKVSGAVHNQTEWSSLLPSMPSQRLHGISARAPRQAQERRKALARTGEI